MAIKQDLWIRPFENRNGERDLVEDEVVVFAAHEEYEPDGAQQHSNVGTQSDKPAKNRPREIVASNLNIELFAFLKASVGIKMRCVDFHLIISTL